MIYRPFGAFSRIRELEEFFSAQEVEFIRIRDLRYDDFNPVAKCVWIFLLRKPLFTRKGNVVWLALFRVRVHSFYLFLFYALAVLSAQAHFTQASSR